MGLTSRRASKVVPWATGITRGVCRAPAPRSSPPASGPVRDRDRRSRGASAGLARLDLRPTAPVGLPLPHSVEGKRIAEKVLTAFPTCPVSEIARLGRTIKQWREAFLAYFDTGRSSNGGTEAINGLIELDRRVARGFRSRDNYRLRRLLIGGGLTSPHLK
jgi:hypothetical protein